MAKTRCNDIPSAECPHCGEEFQWDDYYDIAEGDELDCPKCGKIIHVVEVEFRISATLSTEAGNNP